MVSGFVAISALIPCHVRGALLTRLPSEFGELSKLISDQASRLELFVLTGIAKPYEGVMLGWLL